MIKKNIAIISLDESDAKAFSIKIAKKLDMFFADTNDILALKYAENGINNLSVEDFNINENKLLCEIQNYEQTVIFCNFELVSKENNLEKIKNNAILIYLKFANDNIKREEMSFNYGYAFDIENKFCEKNADCIIEITKKSTTEEVLQKLKEYLSMGEFV